MGGQEALTTKRKGSVVCVEGLQGGKGRALDSGIAILRAGDGRWLLPSFFFFFNYGIGKK